jgi:glutathione S-transferase
MVLVGELVGCTFADFPNIRAWIARMKALPQWGEVHAAHEGFAASLAGRKFVAV